MAGTTIERLILDHQISRKGLAALVEPGKLRELQRQYLDWIPAHWLEARSEEVGRSPLSAASNDLISLWMVSEMPDQAVTDIILPLVADHPVFATCNSPQEALAQWRGLAGAVRRHAMYALRAPRSEATLPTQPMSTGTVRAILKDHFGAMAIEALERAGQLHLIDSVNDLPDDIQARYSTDLQYMAAATLASGEVFMLASRMRPAQVPGIFLHEMGEHASLATMLGADYGRLVANFRRLLGKGDAYASYAAARVPRNTPASVVPSEQLAYLVEKVANDQVAAPGGEEGYKLGQQCLSQLRTWIFRTPLCRYLDTLNVTDKLTLTPADLASLAREATGYAVRQHAADAPLQEDQVNQWFDLLDQDLLDYLYRCSPDERRLALAGESPAALAGYLYGLSVTGAPRLGETLDMFTPDLARLATGEHGEHLQPIAGELLEQAQALMTKAVIQESTVNHGMAMWYSGGESPSAQRLHVLTYDDNNDVWRLKHYRKGIGTFHTETFNSAAHAVASLASNAVAIHQAGFAEALESMRAVNHSTPRIDAGASMETLISQLGDFHQKDDHYQFDNYLLREELINALVDRAMSRDLLTGATLPTGSGTVTIAPSAKVPGSWQVTFFDEDEQPTGDYGYQTREEALRFFFESVRPDLVDSAGYELHRERARQPVTETPEFQRWFKNSRVVSPDGKPLVVYRGQHGDSGGDIQTHLGSITFTCDPGVASLYAQEPNNRAITPTAENPTVIPAYLSLAAPVIDNPYDPFADLDALIPKLGQETVAYFARKYSEHIENTGVWAEDYADYEDVDHLLREQPNALEKLYLDAYVLLDDSEFVAVARSAGFDGAIHMGNGESAEALEYRVFDKRQIKSVNNTGSFDPANDDIRYSAGIQQQPDTPEFKRWFGYSKVVDARGRPLVVYHGTTSDFASFDVTGRYDEVGAFFTTNPATLDEYTAGEGGSVMPVYLSIERPYEVTEYQWARAEGLSPAEARDAGYDGYIVRGMDGADTYIAFHPEQIKSAIGNVGAFDPSNPDIRFSRTGVERAARGRVDGGDVASSRDAITNTPEFKRWFANSQVVDADGNPLRVYHGTQYSFNAFDPDMQGDTVYSEDIGFFFSNDPEEASAYATLDWDREHPQPNVVPAYLSLKNPKIIDLAPEQSPYERPALWYDAEGREAAEQALAEGHDGMIIRDLREDVNSPIDGLPLTLYVAFEPEQIKSAIGNTGTFDPANPDIRFSTPAQEQQVDDAFVEWFGDSKIVDEQGTPLILYHGTNQDFTAFNPEASREGDQTLFATDSYAVASAFALYRSVWNGANVMPIYVKADQVLEVDGNYRPIREVEDSARLDGMQPGESLRGYARRMNYDAICIRNTVDDVGPDMVPTSDVYILMPSAQIKSALGNIGTFDASNPDIRYSMTAPVATAAGRQYVPSYHLQGWMLATNLPQETLEKYARLGELQRGAPENAMLAVQNALGGSPLHPVVEHIGDLTNRMSPKHDIQFAYEETRDKIERQLLSLKSSYGFRRDYEESLESAARYRGLSVEEYTENVNRALDAYANAHAALETYTPLQTMARDAAVALGRREFEKATQLLEQMLAGLDSFQAFVVGLGGEPGVTRTPAFQRWFGNSLVTDDDGRPQIMYHGSYQNLTWFDRQWSTNVRRTSMDNVGSWFTDNPGLGGAEQYANGEGAVIYPVYLSITRPKIYDQFDDFLRDMHEANGDRLEDMSPKGVGSPEALREKLKLQGYDGIAFTKTNIQALHQEVKDREAAVALAQAEYQEAIREAEARGMEFGMEDGRPYQSRIDRLAEALQQARRELAEAGTSTEFDQQYVWVAFEPEQIKSAIGNIGTFDPTNADIRFWQRDAAEEAGRSSYKAFDPDLINEQQVPGYKSRDKLIEMPIADFLALAREGYGEEKESNVQSLLAAGTPFNSLPHLNISKDGRVEGHEGRHRARALAQRGYVTMPVLLRMEEMRWSEQRDPARRDYIANWPAALQAEEGAANPNFSIPFPVSRNQAMDPYNPGTPAASGLRTPGAIITRYKELVADGHPNPRQQMIEEIASRLIQEQSDSPLTTSLSPEKELAIAVRARAMFDSAVDRNDESATQSVRFTMAMDILGAKLFGIEAAALKERIEQLSKLVEQAYESGDPAAEDLDVELETAQSRLEDILSEMEEDGPTLGDGQPGDNPLLLDLTDIEVSLEPALANIYRRAFINGEYIQYLDDEEKAEFIRGQVGDLAEPYGGLKDGVTDQQLLDLIAEAYESAEGKRRRKTNKLVGVGRSLTELLSHMDREQAFKAWFGQSRVVNPDGSPKVVYHGTGASFSVFSEEHFGESTGMGDWGEGFYFTDRPEVAGRFAEVAHGDNPNIMPVHLMIENPATNEVLMSDSVQDALQDDMGFESVRDILAEMGYDGIIWDHKNDGGIEYVVFHPEQIKSAIGNRGTFDSQNPDIRFSRSDTEERAVHRDTTTSSQAFKRWFGNSKVVDAEGSPLRVYHGSDSKFTQFEIGRADGIYFTPNKGLAELYGHHITEAYLKIETLADLTDPASEAYALAVNAFNDAGGWEHSEDAMEDRESAMFDPALDETWELFDNPEADIARVLRDAGYDGAKLDEYNGDVSFVVFQPEQIKSAIDNRGTFDSQNPDIRFTFAGAGAATASIEALNTAIEMQERGAPNQQIYVQTGWYKGLDGRWRYEISDDQARFRDATHDLEGLWDEIKADVTLGMDGKLHTATYKEGTAEHVRRFGHTEEDAKRNLAIHLAKSRHGSSFNINEIDHYTFYKVKDILEHPELLAAYPALGEIKVHFNPAMAPSSAGSWSPSQRVIQLNPARSPAEMLSTLLHELQHVIQDTEDFATGGNEDATFAQSTVNVLGQLVEGRAREVEAWELTNESIIQEVDRAQELHRNALLYSSLQRLESYAQHDTPSSVFRLIRNELQWIQSPLFKGNARASEIERSFYSIPRRGPSRNEAIRALATAGAQLLRDTIPADQIQRFDDDPRTTRSLLAALDRERVRKELQLQPLQRLKNQLRDTKILYEATSKRTPYQIYRALAGEIESRATQARQHLTADERRKRPPAHDYDVPVAEAIVIVGGQEFQLPQAFVERLAPRIITSKSQGIAPEAAPVELVEFDELPTEVQEDLAYALIDSAAAEEVRQALLAHNGRDPDHQDILNELAGLADPIMLPQLTVTPESLSNLPDRSVSDRAVTAYRERLAAGEVPPPILVRRQGDELILVEGGHRAAAALQEGLSLPAVDVSAIFSMDWPAFLNGDAVVQGAPLRSMLQADKHASDVVDNPAFRRWFADSKVVDADGKPLVVYHGTDSVFTEFSRTGDIGYHFGTEIAARDRAARVGGAGVLVEPVTLSQVEKDSLAALNGEIGGTPAADLYALLLRKLDSPRQDLRAQVEAMPADEIKQVKAEYLEQPDSLRFAERVDRAKAGEGFRVEVNGETVSTHRTVREANARAARLREQAAKPMALYLRIENPIRLPDLGVWPAQEIAKEAGFSEQEMKRVVEAGTAEQQYAAVRAILESKGFDGIVYRNEVEHAGEDSYIAFHPEQIKSATDNVGTFDPSNPDIRFSHTGVERAARGRVDGGDVAFSRDAITNSPAFKRWFGDSKVVDAQGKPLVVYHGTTGDFDTFRDDIEGRAGFYFTDDIEFAQQFADGDGANVMPAYLKVSSPADLRSGVPSQVEGVLEAAGYSRLDELLGRDPRDIWNHFDGDRELSDMLQRAGYDGLRLAEPEFKRNVDSWVAFRPEQIKSAIGNRGTFDPSNPDIRFSRTGVERAARGRVDGGDVAFSREAIINSASFKRWFEGSKIVDGEGKPLRVYHGTASEFTAFGNSRGNGFYFTDDPSAASAYAEYAEDDQGHAGPNIVPAYLSIRNPLILDGQWQRDNMDADGEWEWEVLDHALYEAEAAGYDGAILRGFMDYSGFDKGMRTERSYDQYIAFRPEQIKSAIGNVGTFAPGNPDIRFAFAGERSTTADTSLADRARAMADQGYSPDEIRLATGWFEGDDGLWRYEIDDSKATLSNDWVLMGSADDEHPLYALNGSLGSHVVTMNPVMAAVLGRTEGVAPGLLDHPELFQAYPQLADIRVSIQRSSAFTQSSGQYTPRTRQIDVRIPAGREQELLSLLLHEVQHAIQHIEGFSPGGSPDMFDDQISDPVLHERLNNILDIEHIAKSLSITPDAVALGGSFDRVFAERVVHLVEQGQWESTVTMARNALMNPMAKYRRLAGEIEARNVQSRLHMTAEERMAVGPEATRDIPASESLVREYGKLGPQAFFASGEHLAFTRVPPQGAEVLAPVHLKMDAPFIDRAHGTLVSFGELQRAIGAARTFAFMLRMEETIYASASWKVLTERHPVSSIANLIADYPDLIDQVTLPATVLLNYPGVADALASAGHDGAIYAREDGEAIHQVFSADSVQPAPALPARELGRSILMSQFTGVMASKFQQWSEGSHVATEEGAPLVVFSVERMKDDITDALFQSGRGSKRFVNFAQAWDEAEQKYQAGHATLNVPYQVTPAYLAIMNPIPGITAQGVISGSDLFRIIETEQAERIIRQLGVAVTAGRTGTDDTQALANCYVPVAQMLDKPEWVEVFKRAGYDGALVPTHHDGQLTTEYRVFSPDQVLSGRSMPIITTENAGQGIRMSALESMVYIPQGDPAVTEEDGPVFKAQRGASVIKTTLMFEDIPGVVIDGTLESAAKRAAVVAEQVRAQLAEREALLHERSSWVASFEKESPELAKAHREAVTEARQAREFLNRWNTPSRHNCMVWDAPLTNGVKKKVSQVLPASVITDGMTGRAAYLMAIHLLGGHAKAARAFERTGIVGMATPERVIMWDSRSRELARVATHQLEDARFHIAYHGSPHLFQDFSLEKVGTGEGAQAFGYGVYVADSLEVARHYQNYHSALKVLYENEVYPNFQALIEDLVPKVVAAHPEFDDYASQAYIEAGLAEAGQVIGNRLEPVLRHLLNVADYAPERLDGIQAQYDPELVAAARYIIDGIERPGAAENKRMRIMPRQGARGLREIAESSDRDMSFGLQELQMRLHWFVRNDMSDDEIQEALDSYIASVANEQEINQLIIRLEQTLEGDLSPGDREFHEASLRDAQWNLHIARCVQKLCEAHGPLRVMRPIHVGFAYMLDVDVTDDQYLMHDLPFSQQSELVQTALSVLARSDSLQLDQRTELAEKIAADSHGSEFLEALAGKSVFGNNDPDNARATALLLAHGVKGLKYADGLSRHNNTDATTFNYVVFDPADIKVLARTAVDPYRQEDILENPVDEEAVIPMLKMG